jgi:hypothetical protein
MPVFGLEHLPHAAGADAGQENIVSQDQRRTATREEFAGLELVQQSACDNSRANAAPSVGRSAGDNPTHSVFNSSGVAKPAPMTALPNCSAVSATLEISRSAMESGDPTHHKRGIGARKSADVAAPSRIAKGLLDPAQKSGSNVEL